MQLLHPILQNMVPKYQPVTITGQQLCIVEKEKRQKRIAGLSRDTCASDIFRFTNLCI